jgi:hypothetical protein
MKNIGLVSLRGLLSILALMFCASAAVASPSYIGLGISIAETNNKGIIFQEVYTGGPAETAGIVAGELLIAVDSKPVQGMGLDAVSALLQGAIGTHVLLTVSGAVAGQDRVVDLVREIITLDCIAEGSVNLQTNLTMPGVPPTSVSGYVGISLVNWSISGSTVLAFLDGQYYYLTYSRLGTQQQISGYIHNTFVQWMGFNGMITGYQTCIQK